MNEQIFGKRVNTPEGVEQTNPDANNPVVVYSDPSASNTPILANLIYGTPSDGSIPPTDPPATPPEETIVNQAPWGQTTPYVDPDSQPLDPQDRPNPYKVPQDQPTPYSASEDRPVIYRTPQVEPKPSEAHAGANVELSTALLNPEESALLRARWNEILGNFVDEPRFAVQQADTLLADVIEKITQVFANEHSTLEGQWKQGNDVSTEDLRKALQSYRSFFNRLVA